MERPQIFTTTHFYQAFETKARSNLSCAIALLDPPLVTLGEAFENASRALDALGGDLSRLAPSIRTFLLVYSAQGVIDNGGFQYFFEMDWPNEIPYSDFVEAYRQIGALEAADALSSAANMFDFENPHLFEDKRMLFMDNLDRNHLFLNSEMLCAAILRYGNASAISSIAEHPLFLFSRILS